jgi:hypothetical protein
VGRLVHSQRDLALLLQVFAIFAILAGRLAISVDE